MNSKLTGEGAAADDDDVKKSIKIFSINMKTKAVNERVTFEHIAMKTKVVQHACRER